VEIVGVLIVATLRLAGIEDCHLRILEAVLRPQMVKEKETKSLQVEALSTQ
jgi:hypothetical protein